MTDSATLLMRFLARLALGVLLAALAIGLDVIPALQQTGTTQAVVRIVILALVLYGLWRGLAGSHLPARTRLIRWGTVAVGLIVWAAIAWWLALQGMFQQFDFLLPLAIVLPLLIGLPLLLRSAWLGDVLDLTPPSWLVGLQVYRVLGSVFVLGWLLGLLPGVSALPAGIGDTLVGILALPVAGIVRRYPAAGVAWNALGLLDTVDALVLGFLTASGPGAYPLVLFPAFGIPLSVLLHAVSWRQLRRQARSRDHMAMTPRGFWPRSGAARPLRSTEPASPQPA